MRSFYSNKTLNMNGKKKRKFLFFLVWLLALLLLALFTARTIIYNIYRYDCFEIFSSFVSEKTTIDLHLGNIPIPFNNEIVEEYPVGQFSNQLDKNELYVLERIYSASIRKENTVSFTNSHINQKNIKTALNTLAIEHPEFYWLKQSINFKYNRYGYFTIELQDVENASYYEDLVKDIAKKLKKETPYQTIKSVHDYIIDTTEYDLASIMEQDYRSLLEEGKAVCAGYADALTVLLKENGIECYSISGKSNSTGILENHAWVLVKLDDKFYWIDPTWDDNKDRYDFFMMDDTFLANHFPEDGYIYPACMDKSLYMKEYDIVFTSFNKKEIEDVLINMFSKNKSIEMHFTNIEDAEVCYNYLFNNNQRAFKEILTELNYNSITFSYTKRNRSINIIIDEK